MNLIETHLKRTMAAKCSPMNALKKLNRIIICLTVSVLVGCTDFVEIDPPKSILISETVFNDPATVESALANVYFQIREQGLVSGTFGMTTSFGIYADELDYFGFDTDQIPLFNHSVLATNQRVSSWWSHTYYIIYCANDIINGVEESSSLTQQEKDRFIGQALVVRAYMHSLLVDIYGAIPYITTTDYLENNIVARLPLETVHESIINDLTLAIDRMEGLSIDTGERILPDVDVARALLARRYLYTEQWALASEIATALIDNYPLEPNVEEVFLKESAETIWQLKPGVSPRNTQEANQLIIQIIPGQKYALTEGLLSAFEPGDNRFQHWTSSISDIDNTVTLFFAHKYKALLTETQSLEFSIVFRSAEQYLIRAEARAKTGDILGATADIDQIRNRAGLPNTTASSLTEVLEAILQERRVELFAEHGQRWFDLKRTGNAGMVLGPLKPNWQSTDVLFPIPETELALNPNLLPQNNGY